MNVEAKKDPEPSAKDPITGKELAEWIEKEVINKPWDFNCEQPAELILTTTSPADVRKWMPAQNQIKESIKFSVCAPLLPGPIIWVGWKEQAPFYKLRWYTKESADYVNYTNVGDIDGTINYILDLVKSGKILDPLTAFVALKLTAMIGFTAVLANTNAGGEIVTLSSFTPKKYYDATKEAAIYYDNLLRPFGYRVLYLEYDVDNFRQHAVLVPVFLFGHDNPLVGHLPTYQNDHYGERTVPMDFKYVDTEKIYVLFILDPVMVPKDSLDKAVEVLRRQFGINVEIRNSLEMKYRMSLVPKYDEACANEAMRELGYSGQNYDKPFVDAVTCIRWEEPSSGEDVLTLSISVDPNYVPTYKIATTLWAYPIFVQGGKNLTTYDNFLKFVAYDEYTVRLSGLSYPSATYPVAVLNYLNQLVQSRLFYTSLTYTAPACSSLQFANNEACYNAISNQLRAWFTPRPVRAFVEHGMRDLWCNIYPAGMCDAIVDTAYLYFMGLYSLLSENDMRLLSLLYSYRPLLSYVSFYGNDRGILGLVIVSQIPVFAAGISLLVPPLAADVTSISGTYIATKLVPNLDGRFLYEIDDGGFRVKSYEEWLRAIKLMEPVDVGLEWVPSISTMYDVLYATTGVPPTYIVPSDPPIEYESSSTAFLRTFIPEIKALVLNRSAVEKAGLNYFGFLVSLYQSTPELANGPDFMDDAEVYKYTKDKVLPLVEQSINRLAEMTKV